MGAFLLPGIVAIALQCVYPIEKTYQIGYYSYIRQTDLTEETMNRDELKAKQRELNNKMRVIVNEYGWANRPAEIEKEMAELFEEEGKIRRALLDMDAPMTEEEIERMNRH
jgi:hypothetical protein